MSPRPHPHAFADLRSIRCSVAVLLLLSSSCAPTPCPDDAPAAGESFLGLSPAQRASLVEVTGTTRDGFGSCSAFSITPSHLLSALHCQPVLEAEDARLVSASGAPLLLGSLVEHPDLDLLLVVLAEPSTSLPFPLATRVGGLEGERVELTGFSRDDARPWFAMEPVVEVSAAEIVVDSGDAPGACAGDSGAPLLWRGADGDVEALGVLSTGSPGCRGLDRYVRADVIGAGFLPDLPPRPRDCGTLPDEGRCFGPRAVWCEVEPVAEPCPGACGFPQDGPRFQCLDDDDDSVCVDDRGSPLP